MKKIAFISQPEYFRFIYEHDLDDIFEVREFPFHFNMSPNEFNDLIKFDADYNIFFRGEFFPDEVLNKLKGLKIALSSEPFPRKINGKWEQTHDSVKRYEQFKIIKNKKFDYVFHYDASSLPLFEMDGLKISGEFVFPVARKTYKASKNKGEKWDFFFVGRSTNHREDLFGHLKHHYNFLHIAHGIWGPDLVEYMNQSKICLNVHAENEISWEPRMQMMLAAGAFVMSEKITPNKYLRPGIDYVEFSDKVDFIKKVEFYLKNEDKRMEIVENAQMRIAEYFNSAKNFPNFFNKIEAGEYPKFISKNVTSTAKEYLKKLYKQIV